MRKNKTWQHEITGVDGTCLLFGINIFDYVWSNTGEKASVHDPSYNQPYCFPIYRVSIDGKIYKFAAGEFSNCVWGFYLLKY